VVHSIIFFFSRDDPPPYLLFTGKRGAYLSFTQEIAGPLFAALHFRAIGDLPLLSALRPPGVIMGFQRHSLATSFLCGEAIQEHPSNSDHYLTRWVSRRSTGRFSCLPYE